MMASSSSSGDRMLDGVDGEGLKNLGKTCYLNSIFQALIASNVTAHHDFE
jgi:uncharacterized UBP type Zn finger protein